MKLSQLTPEHKTRLLAELDGWTLSCDFFNEQSQYFRKAFRERYGGSLGQTPVWVYLPHNWNSYDAIIPLVQKLWKENRLSVDLFYKALPDYHPTIIYFIGIITPSKLCDAVLVATGKAEL